MSIKEINGTWFPLRDVNTPRGVQKAEQMIVDYYYDALEEGMSYCTDYSVAVDGGANVGLWARKMAEKFENVHSFEIDPNTFECLCKNVVTRAPGKVITYNMGLSNTIGTSTIADGWNEKSMGTHLTPVHNVKIRNRASTIRSTEIPTVTIDSLDLPSLGFVKLDVEGHEAQAIEGGRETIMKYKPIIMIEYKPELNARYSTTDPAKLLESMGARLIDKIGKRNVEWIFGW